MKPKVIAIGCADLHLSHKPPIWRSNEPDWYAAMTRPLNELSELQRIYKCPVLCAGDIFDKWDSPAELINFAIENLPNEMYAIAGQHDLPNHNIEEIKRSAYHTIALLDKFSDVSDCTEGHFNIDKIDFVLNGFPYGSKITKPVEDNKIINIALVHDYVWIPGCHYDPKLNKTSSFNKKNVDKNGKYFGYDVIIYGDNHQSFTFKLQQTTIVNCGSLMRRNKDQEDYSPKVWLIYSDGSVEAHFLDISKDIHLSVDEMKTKEEIEDIDMSQFANELKKLSSSAIDFSNAVEQYYIRNDVKEEVKNIISEAMKK